MIDTLVLRSKGSLTSQFLRSLSEKKQKEQQDLLLGEDDQLI